MQIPFHSTVYRMGKYQRKEVRQKAIEIEFRSAGHINDLKNTAVKSISIFSIILTSIVRSVAEK